GGFWNTQTNDVENTPNPLVYDTGNSYDVNYHFSTRWALHFFPPGMSSQEQALIRQQWLKRSNKFLAIQRRLNASRFIITYEDPFDSSLWGGMLRVGWHRQLARHSVLFLDSHAANLRMDTSGVNATSGPPHNQYAGWKTASGFWWVNPED